MEKQFRPSGRVRVILAGLVCAALPSCTSQRPAEVSKPVPPAPAELHIDAKVSLDVPAPVARESGLPTELNGRLIADGHAESIPENPRSVRYSGTVHFLLTDPRGVTYVDFGTTLKGQAEGTPNDALDLMYRRLLDTSQFLETGTKLATTRPSSKP